MKKISWRNIAEVLGVLSVVAGLFLVAWEIRSNTAAVESASSQAVTDASLEALNLLASDAELAHIRRIGDLDPESLTEDEAWRYWIYYRGYWLRFQNVFFQRQMNVLGERLWGSYMHIMCNDIQKSGIRAGWPDHAAVLNPEFVAAVESCPDF